MIHIYSLISVKTIYHKLKIHIFIKIILEYLIHLELKFIHISLLHITINNLKTLKCLNIKGMK